MELKILGERLKEVRSALSLTQKQVAEELGCQQNSLSRLEKGDGAAADLVLQVLSYYRKYCSLDWLFSDKYQIFTPEKGFNIKETYLPELMKEKMLLAKEEIAKTLENAHKDIDKRMEDVMNLIDKE